MSFAKLIVNWAESFEGEHLVSDADGPQGSFMVTHRRHSYRKASTGLIAAALRAGNHAERTTTLPTTRRALA